MTFHTLRRSGIAAAAVLALSASLAACGSDNSSSSGSPSSDSSDSSSSAAGAGAQTFGDGCASVPTSGDGSFDGMVNDPVATAASNNPLLQTLVAAVGAVPGLGDTLNSQEALTVFAPYEGAFEEIPPADLQGLLDGAAEPDGALGTILSHHVLAENDDPEALVGDHDTLAGDSLTIEGDPESGMTVSDGTVTANIICGNVPTANATVYVIDKVLTGVQ